MRRKTVLVSQGRNRNKTLKIDTIHNTINIASVNGDSRRTREPHIRIIELLKKGNIDISCIQEPRSESLETYEENDYAILFGGREMMKKLRHKQIKPTRRHVLQLQ